MHHDNDNENDPDALAESTYSQYVWQQGVDAFLRDHDVNHQAEPVTHTLT